MAFLARTTTPEARDEVQILLEALYHRHTIAFAGYVAWLQDPESPLWTSDDLSHRDAASVAAPPPAQVEHASPFLPQVTRRKKGRGKQRKGSCAAPTLSNLGDAGSSSNRDTPQPGGNAETP